MSLVDYGVKKSPVDDNSRVSSHFISCWRKSLVRRQSSLISVNFGHQQPLASPRRQNRIVFFIH